MPRYPSHILVMLLAGAIMLALQTGCSITPEPTPEEIAAADFGPPVQRWQAEKAAGLVLNEMLKDPHSAQIHYQRFGKALISAPGGWGYGYVLEVKVNARNGFGAYTGWQYYYFAFRDRGFFLEGLPKPYRTWRWVVRPDIHGHGTASVRLSVGSRSRAVSDTLVCNPRKSCCEPDRTEFGVCV